MDNKKNQSTMPTKKRTKKRTKKSTEEKPTITNWNPDADGPYHPLQPGDKEIFPEYNKLPLKDSDIAPVYSYRVVKNRKTVAVVRATTYLSNIGERTCEFAIPDGDTRKRKTYQEDFTARQIAERNLQNLLRSKHRSGHSCFVLQEKGRNLKKDCRCVANLAGRLQEEEQETSNRIVAEKWIPRFEEFAWFLLEIHKDPDNENHNSLMAWLEIAHPFCLDGKQNSNVDWMVDLNGENIHFCLSSVWEFKGFHQGRHDTYLFMKTFILSEAFKKRPKEEDYSDEDDEDGDEDGEDADQDGEDKETPNYFRDIALPNANKRKILSWCMKKCIKSGRICVFAARKFQETKKNKEAIKKYYREMEKDGLVLNNKREPMDPEDEQRTQRHWRPVVTLIHQWNSEKFLVIAHPNMHRLDRTVPPLLAVVLFQLHGGSVVTDIEHVGNAGTASLVFYGPELRKLSHDGFRNRKFYASSFPAATNESVVLQSDLGVHQENPLQVLATYLLGMPDAHPPSLNDCFQHIVSCCKFLIPEDKRPSPDAVIWSEANVLLSARKDYKQTKNHFAQSPYMVKEEVLKSLKDVSIVSYVVTIPLTEDGCWLHVFPNGFTEDGERSDTGQMVYVPFGSMFLQPITTIHGGGFRTSFNGNRRIQMLLHFVPAELSTDQTRAILSQPFEKKYFGSTETETGIRMIQVESASYQLNNGKKHAGADKIFHTFCTEFGY